MDIQQPKTLFALLKMRQFNILREQLIAMPSMDIAPLLATIPEEEGIILITLLPVDRQRHVLDALEPDPRQRLFRQMPMHHLVTVFRDAPSDMATRWLAGLGQQSEHILQSLPLPQRKRLRRQLGYGVHQIGRLVNHNCFVVRNDWSCRQALQSLRQDKPYHGPSGSVFVVDEHRHLRGQLRLRKLVFGVDNHSVSSLLDNAPVVLRADEDFDTAVRLAQHYDLNEIAVVDSHQQFLGVITIDVLMDVAHRRATSDMQRIGAVGLLGLPLLHASAALLYRKRVYWLLGLMLMGTLSVIVLSAFAVPLGQQLLIVMFLPLIMDCGGNAGAQSAILMVRAMAKGEISSADSTMVIRREWRVAVALAATLAFPVVLLGLWRDAGLFTLVVTGTLVIAVLMGSILGSLLPLLLQRLGRDPALASAPLVSTLVDIAGVTLYLLSAAYFLG